MSEQINLMIDLYNINILKFGPKLSYVSLFIFNGGTEWLILELLKLTK